MLTLSIVQFIIIVYCVWAYSFVLGIAWADKLRFSDFDKEEKILFIFMVLLSPITVWMLFIDND